VHTSLWEAPGEVLHVRLAHESEVLVIAPATADLIAKLAVGLADDLLSCVALEFDGPLVVAPAMHAGMWSSPATVANVAALTQRGARVVGPEDGSLAHGDSGLGRLSEPEDVLTAVIEAAGGEGVMKSRHIVVTAGPTHEPIDPVRYLGNRSSGRMGVEVARALLRRGARVTLVLGPGTVEPPPGAAVERVETADAMRAATLRAFEDADAVVMAAAVADFRPKMAAEDKLKKEQGPPDLVLEPTPDILSELGATKGSRIVVGFAAETDDPVLAGRDKLARKRCDLLVANRVGAGTGFGTATNEAALLAADGDDEPFRRWTKRELADVLADRIASLLAERL